MFRRAAMTVTLGLGLLFVAAEAPAMAAFHPGYKQTATNVANGIGCKHLRLKSHGGMVRTGLVCDLKAKRANVITFKSENQEISWLSYVSAAYPNGGYVAVARGVVIIARNGNESAAKVGALPLHGQVVPIGG